MTENNALSKDNKAEKPTDRPIPILFLVKMYDQTVYDVLVDLVDYLIKDPNVLYYFMDQKPKKAVAERYPELDLRQFNANDIELEKQIEYVVSIGGDGTVLFSGKLFQHRSTPKIAAIEKGTLGFLCKLKPSQLPTIAYAMLEDSTKTQSSIIELEKKMRLRCEKLSKKEPPFVFHCLNQVAITKADSETMLKLEIYLEGELFTITSGDGLLVSTPTGSTAYALSAGGPIIHNSIRTTLIQPICPNSLSFRSICIPSNIQLKIKVSQQSNTIGFISFDGQISKDLDKEDTLIINESTFDVNLMTFREDNQLTMWTSKLKSLLKFNKQFKNCISEKFSIALKSHQSPTK